MPNTIIPEYWLYDPVFSKLRPHTQLMLFRLALRKDNHWRYGVGTSPEVPDFLCSTLYPMNREVRVSDVARCLAEAKAAGVVSVKPSDRGWYVEFEERFRYRRDDYQEGQPKFGDRIVPVVKQQELPMGPVGEVPLVRKKGGVAGAVGAQIQAKRVRVEGVVATESCGEIRALSRGGDSGRFARDEGEFPNDGAWSDFCRLLCFDMVTNGAAWAKRWREDRGACFEAMQDWLSKTPEERASGNAAAYITKAFGNRSRRMA